jgi:hypothetical protein
MMQNRTAEDCVALINRFMEINFPQIGFFVQLFDEVENKTIYFGDLCPRCSADNIAAWALENNVQHIKEHTVN